MLVCTPALVQTGFGNAFHDIAKALVCSRELGARYWPGYWQMDYAAALPPGLVASSRAIHLAQRLRYRLTHHFLHFGEAEHKATEIVPVEEALPAFLSAQGLSTRDDVVVALDGLAPGLECIERHAAFLHGLLLSGPGMREAMAARTAGLEPGKLHIGVHIRRGDFRPALPLGEAWPEGKWNIGIPLEWYDLVCQHLAEAFPGRVQFLVATNATGGEVDDFSRRHGCILAGARAQVGPSDVGDILALASCDLVVASVSWFSGWASILGQKPFLWYPCAHGRPAWGGGNCFLYTDEPELPTGLTERLAHALAAKETSRTGP